jgi:hypothetical protein
MNTPRTFARRQNEDHSVDSICMRCYQTIASAPSGSDFKTAEQNHLCNRYGEFNQAQVDFHLGSPSASVLSL